MRNPLFAWDAMDRTKSLIASVLRRWKVWVLLVALLATCQPYKGELQEPQFPGRPVNFVDSANRTPIDEVLIIPRYAGGYLFGLGPGHGPIIPLGSGEVYLANPFVYRRGEPFKVKPVDSIGLLIGFGLGFFGYVDGYGRAAAIAPGYRPYLLGGYRPEIKLEPIERTESEALLDQIGILAGSARIENEDTGLWRDQWDNPRGPFAVSFTDDERSMIRRFIRENTVPK